MTSRHERLTELFALARRLPASERRERLRLECPDDPALCDEVVALLDEAEQPDALLDDPAGDTLRRHAERVSSEPRAGSDEPIPVRIGTYAILGVLGEGGMGRVYEAEQDKPRRRVALKLLRTGTLTAAAQRRFELEAEIAGRLQHPGIAQVLEAGVAEVAGFGLQPYIAMELVRGRTLTRHASEKHLGVRDRIELLARICDAVQHAHERGVVHRDLKPANILVDEQGNPRIVDFGIARVADAGASLTGTGHVVGTLAYMAPEQVRGRSSDVDARSDVYALGAIGWELLTGRSPHALADASLPEAARRIAEEEIPRLSSVDRSLRGDLETILAKALEKDRARRYASASELAADLRRYLADEPIFARPPSLGYQLRKFTRRHRAAAAAAVLALAALIAGTAIATWQANVARGRAREAEAARLQAESARREAERVAYKASLAAAVAGIQSETYVDARAQLEAAPKELRGWEWQAIAAQLDRSDGLVAVLPWARSIEAASDGTRLVVVGAPSPRVALVDPRTGRVLDSATWKDEDERIVVSPELAPMVAGMVDLPQGREAIDLVDASGRVLQRVVRCLPGDVAERRQGRLAGGLVVVTGLVSGTWPREEWVVGTCDGATGRLAWSARSLPSPDVHVAPDGRRIVEGSQGDGSLILRDAETGRPLASLPPEGSDLSSLAFSPDGRLLASGAANDGTVRVHDAATLKTLHSRKAGVGRVPVAFAGDGRILISGAPGGALRSSDTSLATLASLPGHAGTVLSIVALPSEDAVFSLDMNGELRRWRTDRIDHQPGVLGPSGTYVYSAAWSADGNRVLVGTWDGGLAVWDARSERRLAVNEELRIPKVHYGTRFVPLGDGSALAGFAAPDSARVDPATARVLETYHDGMSGRYELAPDGRRLVAELQDRDGIVVIDRESRAVIRRFSDLVMPADWSSDGKLLLAARSFPQHAFTHEKESVVVLDASTLEERATYPLPLVDTTALAWSPDDRAIVATGNDGRVVVLDAATGRVLAQATHPGRLFALTFTPDGRRMIVGGDGGALRVFDVATWTDVVSLPGHGLYVYSTAWSPDGKRLATASGDGTVRLWGG